jgi:hypothetical protein
METNKRVIISEIEKSASYFEKIDEILKNDKDFILSLIEVNSEIYPYLNEDLKKDNEIVLAAIRSDNDEVINGIIKTPELVYYLLENHPKTDYLLNILVDGLSQDLWDNFDVVNKIVENDPSYIIYASDNLKENFGLAAHAFAYSIPSIDYGYNYSLNDYELPTCFEQDKAFYKEVVSINQDAYQLIPEEFFNDKSFIIDIVSSFDAGEYEIEKNNYYEDSSTLKNFLLRIPKSFFEDLDFVYQLGVNNCEAIKYISN